MKHARPAILLTLFFVVLTGLAFPGAVWVMANLVFPRQAGGSLIENGAGKVVGSGSRSYLKSACVEKSYPRRSSSAHNLSS